MSSKRIYDLVRSLTKPYLGADCILDSNEIKIWKCRILEPLSEFENIEPGKVIFSGEGRITVKTGDGLIEIFEHTFDKLPNVGDYL